MLRDPSWTFDHSSMTTTGWRRTMASTYYHPIQQSSLTIHMRYMWSLELFPWQARGSANHESVRNAKKSHLLIFLPQQKFKKITKDKYCHTIWCALWDGTIGWPGEVWVLVGNSKLFNLGFFASQPAIQQRVAINYGLLVQYSVQAIEWYHMYT
jgi:hypothetical protein